MSDIITYIYMLIVIHFMTAYCVRLHKCLENKITITVEMSYRNDLFTALTV